MGGSWETSRGSNHCHRCVCHFVWLCNTAAWCLGQPKALTQCCDCSVDSRPLQCLLSDFVPQTTLAAVCYHTHTVSLHSQLLSPCWHVRAFCVYLTSTVLQVSAWATRSPYTASSCCSSASRYVTYCTCSMVALLRMPTCRLAQLAARAECMRHMCDSKSIQRCPREALSIV